MQSSATKQRRKVVLSDTIGDSADKQELLLISSAVCNNDDLGLFIRKGFAFGKPETLLHHLRHFARQKESKIEDICKAYYQDFILAVNYLRSLLSDVKSLKSSLSKSNSIIHSASLPLLSSIDSLQLSLPQTALEMATIEMMLQIPNEEEVDDR